MRAFGLVDRWLTGRFVRAYLTFTGAVLGSFLIVDLFANLQGLQEKGLLRSVFARYAVALPELYFTAGPFVALLAALWVIAQLQRQNELVPLLAAGLSPLRLAWPLLLVGLVLAGLAWVDRELVLPRLGFLRRQTRELASNSWDSPRPIPDGQGGVLSPRFFSLPASELRDVRFTRLDDEAREVQTVLAARGRPAPEGWLLENGVVIDRDPTGQRADSVAVIGSEGWLLRTRLRVDDIEAAVDSPAFQSGKQIRDQLRRAPGFKHLAVRLHERITYPLAGIALLLVAVPIALRAQGGWDTFLRSLLAIALGFGYFIATTIGYELGSKGALEPWVAAYGPLIVFGHLGLVLLIRDARRV